MKSTLYICYKIMAILMVLPVSNGFEDNIYNMGDEDPVQEKIDPEMDEPDDSGIIADSDPSIDEPPLIAISTDGYFKGVNVTTVKGVAIKYNDDIFYPTEAQPSPPPMHIDSSEMRRKFKQKSRTVDNFKPYPQKDDISPEAEGTSTIVTELPCNATAIEEDYYRSIMEHVAFDKCLAQVPDLTENDIQDYRTLSIYSGKAVYECRMAYQHTWPRLACVHIRISNSINKARMSLHARKHNQEIFQECVNPTEINALLSFAKEDLDECEKKNALKPYKTKMELGSKKNSGLKKTAKLITKDNTNIYTTVKLWSKMDSIFKIPVKININNDTDFRTTVKLKGQKFSDYERTVALTNSNNQMFENNPIAYAKQSSALSNVTFYRKHRKNLLKRPDTNLNESIKANLNSRGRNNVDKHNFTLTQKFTLHSKIYLSQKMYGTTEALVKRDVLLNKSNEKKNAKKYDFSDYNTKLNAKDERVIFRNFFVTVNLTDNISYFVDDHTHSAQLNPLSEVTESSTQFCLTINNLLLYSCYFVNIR